MTRYAWSTWLRPTPLRRRNIHVVSGPGIRGGVQLHRGCPQVAFYEGRYATTEIPWETPCDATLCPACFTSEHLALWHGMCVEKLDRLYGLPKAKEARQVMTIEKQGPYGHRCEDCGRNHSTGASAVYCDYAQGKPSPSLADDKQSEVADEFRRNNPQEAMHISAVFAR